jgi:hypothetical protein
MSKAKGTSTPEYLASPQSSLLPRGIVFGCFCPKVAMSEVLPPCSCHTSTALASHRVIAVL